MNVAERASEREKGDASVRLEREARDDRSGGKGRTQDDRMGPNLCLLVCQMVAGLVSVPLLLGASLYLLVWQASIGASIFFLVSGILSAAGLFLNFLLFRQQLDEWYDPVSFDRLKGLAFLTGSASLIAFGYHLTKAIRLHSGQSPLLTHNLASSFRSFLPCLLSRRR